MKGGLPKEETFVSKRLQSLGYETGLVGKWHLGYPSGFQPNDRGFDWFYGCLQGSRPYFPMDRPTPHRVFLENTEPTKEGGYTTDRIGDAAVRFIEANKNQTVFPVRLVHGTPWSTATQTGRLRPACPISNGIAAESMPA